MRSFQGKFVQCRHYKAIKRLNPTFLCKKHRQEKTTCEGCITCPKCGGQMFTHRMDQKAQRTKILINHAKICVLCGAYIEEIYTMLRPKLGKKGDTNKCHVHGCNHTAYEGHTHIETNAEGEAVVFLICLSHYRRIKTWRHHPDKGENEKPLLVCSGTLIDNPQYEKKQGKKNTDHSAQPS